MQRGPDLYSRALYSCSDNAFNSLRFAGMAIIAQLNPKIDPPAVAVQIENR